MPIDIDDTEGTGRYAITAAIARVGLNHDGVELGARDGAGRAYFEAGRMNAVLAHVAHQQPTPVDPAFGELLDELDVAPVNSVKLARVVVAVAAQRVHAAVGAR
jgi:hypothetical protein